MRTALVALHRWLGLTTALFLLLAGSTGALLAWEPQLDAWLAPGLHRVGPSAAPFLAPLEIRRRVAEQLARQGAAVDVVRVEFPRHAGRSVRLGVRPAGGAAEPGYDEVFANPYTGAVLGVRDTEGWPTAAASLMPFVFRLHCALALPDPWGRALLGLVSLLWTLDCFIGGWVTLPPGRGRAGGRGWWRQWGTSWSVKRAAAPFRRMLDLHRAGGLWLWAGLFLLAWSSVMFNLAPVWRPVMGLAFQFDDSWREQPARVVLPGAPPMDWDRALARARQAMAAMAQRQGLQMHHEQQLGCNPGQHTCYLMAHTSADLREDVGNTAVLVDADTGALLATWLPVGSAPGNTVGNWMGAFHMAHLFGLPGRWLITALGLAVVGLSATGVWVWARKRRARRTVAARRREAASGLRPLPEGPVKLLNR